MSEQLLPHLFSLSSDLLRDIAKRLGCLAKGETRKEQFIASISQIIQSRPSEIVDLLSPAEKMLLAVSIQNGRLMSVREFSAKFGLPYPPLSSSKGYNSKEPSLLGCLLKFDPMKGPQLAPGTQSLKQFLPAAEVLPARTLPAPPELWKERRVQIFQSERVAPVELSRVLRLVQSGKIKVTDSSKRPTDASVRLLTGALVGSDFELEVPTPEASKFDDPAGSVRAHAWGVLVQQCGWAKAKGGTLTLTQDGKAMAENFDPGLYQAGVGGYLVDDMFDELHRVNNLRGQSGKCKRWISNPSMRKIAIEEGLGAAPEGEWIEFLELVRLMDTEGASYGVLENPRAFLYIGEAQYGYIYESRPIDLQYIRAVVMESLATLGLVDIAYVYPHRLWPELGDGWGRDAHSFLGRYDGLLSLRLNALGSFCLGRSTTWVIESKESAKLFHILPNLELTLTGDRLPDVSELALLEQMAVLMSERLWRLDAERILGSLEAGGSVAGMREFLAKHAAEGIPDTVSTWLTDLERKARSCSGATKAVLLEWTDPIQAVLLANDSEAGKLCYLAGENRLVVPERKLQSFKRLARKMGCILPEIT